MAAKKPGSTRGPNGRRPRLAGGFLSGLLEAASGGLEDAAKVTSFVGSRLLAANARCVNFVARYMVADELGEDEWEHMMSKDRKLYEQRAKAALLGLDRYLRSNSIGDDD